MTTKGGCPAAFSPAATFTGSRPLPAITATRSFGESSIAGRVSGDGIDIFVAIVIIECGGEEVAFLPRLQEIDDFHRRRKVREVDLCRCEILRDGPTTIEHSSIGTPCSM